MFGVCGEREREREREKERERQRAGKKYYFFEQQNALPNLELFLRQLVRFF
jgi:hypothetical protein